MRDVISKNSDPPPPGWRPGHPREIDARARARCFSEIFSGFAALLPCRPAAFRSSAKLVVVVPGRGEPRMTDAMASLRDSSLADALGSANPYKNLMGHLEANDDFRRENPQLVDRLFKSEEKTGKVNLLRSAGPVSDAYILSTAAVSCLVGPVGSGKTIASVKKGLVEAQRIYPGADGVRRYKLGNFRQKYDSVWSAAIPSHWKVFPKDLVGSRWTGAKPRAAQHVLEFEDAFGRIEMVKDFSAFGEDADPEDVRGLEYTDIDLGEMDTLPPELLPALSRAVGREPPREVIRRLGRIFGDMNAPDVLNWTYPTLYEKPPVGFQLFRQPGGMDPGAENLEAHGGDRAYYENIIAINANNPWYVRRMVHAIPGITRATDLVYDRFDESMISPRTILVAPALPVIVGIDGGLTPSAVYAQEKSNGQFCVLAEIALARGGVEELGAAMLALEARRFPDCEFADRCDPSMLAGEDRDTQLIEEQQVSKGSDRQRLSEVLGRRVEPARSNDVGRRHDAVRAKIAMNCGPGQPGYLLDPSCLGLIRGKRQTYQFRKLRGTNDLSSVKPTFDTHVADAEQYAAMECGTEVARKRRTDRQQRQQQVRDRNRKAGRYNPFARRRA